MNDPAGIKHSPKIRIAFLIDQMNIGGTEKQLVELIRYIDKRRFEVYLYCLRKTAYFDELELPCTKMVLDVRSLLSTQGILRLIQFSRELRQRRIDILHLFFFDATVFGTLAAKLGGCSKVVAGKRDLGFWYTPRLLSILRILSPLTDAYLANSDAVKRVVMEMEKVPAGKISVIHNGFAPPGAIPGNEIESLKRQLNIPAHSKTVGIVANLNRPVKRVDLLVKAAAVLKMFRNDIDYVVVGDGHLKKELIRLAEALGVSDRFVFTGLKRDPHRYIAMFDIGMLTSDSEGFSNSIIEYFGNGVPVIAADNSGNSELVKNGYTGILFPAGDYRQLASAINRVLDRDFASEEMRENCRQSASAFFWPKVIDKMEKFYVSL